MEIRSFPETSARLPEGFRLEYLAAPEPAGYLRMYDQVGSDLNWVDRKLLSPEELSSRISPDFVKIFVLRKETAFAGYAELNCQDPANVELCYFGLIPEFRGAGLGKSFLSVVTDLVKQSGASRFWLHTCELDHPAAIPNYEKAGFRIYETRMENQCIAE